jgi:tetratricopeptide (TPR) repeat protein
MFVLQATKGAPRVAIAPAPAAHGRPPRTPTIMTRHPLLLASAALLMSGAVSAQEPTQAARTAVPLYTNLGAHSRTISTTVPEAQRYFDQGLRLYYAFNHAEAIRAFDEALRRDPRCAMCAWGSALAYGPNINLPMDSAAGVAAWAAVRRAVDRAGNSSPVERALIMALEKRYSATPRANRAALDSAYADAMAGIAAAHPDDVEIQALYAESMMDLSPWNYWNRDGSPRPHTAKVLEALERVMSAQPDHPGANHFYIHAVEAVEPERAVAAAERLAKLMPGAGHLVHMPGHIYIRVGRYLDAIAANEHAVHADESYIRDQQPAFGTYVAGYYPHNYDFLAFAASMVGRSAQAIAAAEKMATLAPPDVLGAPGLTFTQHHATRHLQFRVRFAQWDRILAEPEPAAGLSHARAMWHYARGRALAAKGNVAGASAEVSRLRALATDSVVAAQRLEFNSAGAVLAIAVEVLDGFTAAARGDTARAVAKLRAATALEDALTYGEPPEWTVPVREELGVVLLRAGQASDAEQVFREDLARFPENGWSLHGLAQSLHAQGKSQEAQEVEGRFVKAWATADVQLGRVSR